jgi:hypothetical protein
MANLIICKAMRRDHGPLLEGAQTKLFENDCVSQNRRSLSWAATGCFAQACRTKRELPVAAVSIARYR